MKDSKLKLKADKAVLAGVLKQVLPCVERKATIPILANVLVQADNDGQVAVTGTNLDVALTVYLDGDNVKVMSPGKVCIPARKLADTLAKLKTLDQAEVEITELENYWVSLKCGALTVKLPGMSPENYPQLAKAPTDRPTVLVSGKVLEGLITRTRYAIAATESRYTLNGALFVAGRETVKMVATDGHRCAVAEHAEPVQSWQGADIRMLVPRDTIDILHGLAVSQKDRSVTVTHDETHLFVTGNDWALVGRLMTGQFPNYEAILPKSNGKVVRFENGKVLAASLARVSAFADDRSKATRWELVPNHGVKISAQSTETGEASELVPVRGVEDDCTLGFDASYVQDILQTLGKDQAVTLALRDAQSAGLWRPEESNGWQTLCVVMPLRI